jgi:hypothetical protein
VTGHLPGVEIADLRDGELTLTGFDVSASLELSLVLGGNEIWINCDSNSASCLAATNISIIAIASGSVTLFVNVTHDRLTDRHREFSAVGAHWFRYGIFYGQYRLS